MSHFGRTYRMRASGTSVPPGPLVERLPRLIDLRQVLLRPEPDAAEGFAERRTQAGELVLHLGRDHRIDGPADQAVALHLPQCLGQHLLTDAGHELAYPREAEGSMLGEGLEDEHGPFVGDA